MHLKAKMTTSTISYALLMLYIQLHFAHTAFWQAVQNGKLSKNEKLSNTEKGKGYRKNYPRREIRLDVDKLKSLNIHPSAPLSKIPTLYYSEALKN